MSETPSTQSFAFPPEKQAQIEQQRAARMARTTPYQPQQHQSPRHQQQHQPSPQQQRQPVTVPTSGPGVPNQVQPPFPQRGIPPQVQQMQYPAVDNPMPGFTTPVADPEGTSLALPSRFAFYRFQDLYAKPFKALHLAKLSRAHAEGSLQLLVETVSSVLSTTTPGVGPLGFELTLPDFYFVLYWLRQNSYTKSSFVHKTTCADHGHLEQVTKGELAPETLQIAQVINKGQLTVNELEQLPDPEYFKFNDDVPFYLTPATMRTAIEFAESPKMNSPEHEEFEYLAQLGSFVQHKGFLDNVQGYWTLEQRAKAMEEADGDEVRLIQEFEKALEGYGVDEKVTVTCKVCGASREAKVSLDAHSFLSFD
jgi:hypothetical protein